MGAGGWSTISSRARRVFPENPSQFFAYDAIILSNVPRDVLSDEHLAWIEEWVGRRGGGLCMAGGPSSFASGHWNEHRRRPDASRRAGPRRPRLGRRAGRASGRPPPAQAIRSGISPPMKAVNQKSLKALPSFLGSNRFGRVKPGGRRARPKEPRPVLRARCRQRSWSNPSAEAARWR